MFTIDQAGPFADGYRIRVCLGNLLASMYRHHPRGGEGIYWAEVSSIVEALDRDKTDDAMEEHEAIEWLNKMCEEGCHFEIVDDNLILINESPDYCSICGAEQCESC